MKNADNSHHRLFVGHLPHYYVPKGSGKLSRQDKPISMAVRSIRSVLGYSLVEDLSTGGALVELYEMTTAEVWSDVHSIALDLTLAWLGRKLEPLLCPAGVPANLWVEKDMLACASARDSVEEACAELGIELCDYSPRHGPFEPVRSQAHLEHLIEHVVGQVDYITAHNHDFSEYRLALAHACGRWLGTHRQMFDTLSRHGTPYAHDDDMTLADRELPDTWFAGFEKRTPRQEWMVMREHYFSLP